MKKLIAFLLCLQSVSFCQEIVTISKTTDTICINNIRFSKFVSVNNVRSAYYFTNLDVKVNVYNNAYNEIFKEFGPDANHGGFFSDIDPTYRLANGDEMFTRFLDTLGYATIKNIFYENGIKAIKLEFIYDIAGHPIDLGNLNYSSKKPVEIPLEILIKIKDLFLNSAKFAPRTTSNFGNRSRERLRRINYFFANVHFELNDSIFLDKKYPQFSRQAFIETLDHPYKGVIKR